MSPVLKISQDSAEIFKFLLKFNQNCPFWAHPSHFGGKIGHYGSFEPLWCEMIWKSWKTENICWCTPPHGMKIFEISPKMRCFGGKRWEKLWIGWNWSFWVNLSFILGEKMEKPAKWPKLAFLSQSKPLFDKICHCGSFWASLVWNDLKKLRNSKICWCTPPRTKTFEISPKMRCFGGKRWRKLWIGWNWPFQVNLSLILGKRWRNLQNDQNWPFGANLSHFFGKICHINQDSAEIFKFSSVLIIA